MRLALFWAATLVSQACGGGNSLEGSIEESYSLEFDEVRIRKQNLALLIEYIRDVPKGIERVCQVVIDTDGLKLGDDTNLKGDTFLARVEINRVASGGDFPEIDEGQIQFEKFEFEDGGAMQGEFDAVFVGGRTLHGNFEGEVDEIVLD